MTVDAASIARLSRAAETAGDGAGDWGGDDAAPSSSSAAAGEDESEGEKGIDMTGSVDDWGEPNVSANMDAARRWPLAEVGGEAGGVAVAFRRGEMEEAYWEEANMLASPAPAPALAVPPPCRVSMEGAGPAA
jgi:hypothetical protein